MKNNLIEDPVQLAEPFNVFFKGKIENLASRIKMDPNINPFSHLKEKLLGSNLKFKLNTVNEKIVLKILKSLKSKRSYGHDGISSEVLKLGAEVLVVPLTYIINSSILTGKFPTNWKIAKVVPLSKKAEKKLMKNQRPVVLLSVAGMILERVVALQIEECFEKNKLFPDFQFGFRKKKNTTSELLTLFYTIFEAKEMKKEILVLLYDLSSAFGTVSHNTLLEKVKMYGFCNHSIKWMESYLENRKQKVEVSGKISSYQGINIGTPQGSRFYSLQLLWLTLIHGQKIVSCLILLMILSDNRKDLLEKTSKEANCVINFFKSNNLVNNPDKAAILFNCKGKGEFITVDNVGGEKLKST